jgi:DNA polymerase-4
MSWSPRSRAVRRNWGSDETGCTFLHVDMDAFFAAAEMARHPETKGKPVIVARPASERGVVATANYEARKYGVHSAMATATAQRLCPQAIWFPGDHAYYSQLSHQIFGGLVASITDQIEQVSVDEAYVDVRGALLRWGSPSAIGAYIRREVARRWHITCSVGIASNMMMAKLASTNAKPDGMLLVPRSRNADFVALLPLGALNGVGPALLARLKRYGISTVLQVRELSETELEHVTGSPATAHWLFLASRGESERKLVVKAPEKSIGAERTLMADTRSIPVIEDVVRRCADEVATRLRAHHVLARTVTLKLRYSDLSYVTRAQSVPVPTQDASQLYPVARHLLWTVCGVTSENEPARESIRLAGVTVSGLSDVATTAIQPLLDFDTDPQNGEETNKSWGFTGSKGSRGSKGSQGSLGYQAPQRDRLSAQHNAEKAIDSIRQRYGSSSVHLGVWER